MPDQMMREAPINTASAAVDYRNNMDFPMESLAITLNEFGLVGDSLSDAELVEVAIRKLRTLHGMVLATGMSPALLKAVMKE